MESADSNRYTERDSRKDEAVVFIFIFATVGLLVWAAVKPWVSKWVDVSFVGFEVILRQDGATNFDICRARGAREAIDLSWTMRHESSR